MRGEVKVGHVGSGDLTFADVHGGVQIDSVGSGDVDASIAPAAMSWSVRSARATSTVDGVGGNFIVQSAGSGDIHHHNVTGKVDVPKRHEDD